MVRLLFYRQNDHERTDHDAADHTLRRSTLHADRHTRCHRISAMKKRGTTLMLGATNIPLLNADIVTGISLMLLFVKFLNLGFVTVLIAQLHLISRM